MRSSRRADPRVWYVQTRYEEVTNELDLWGYAIDERSAHSRWNEKESRADPVVGLVLVRGVRLAADGPDERIIFNVQEVWTKDRRPEGAVTVQGNTLVAYHYHGQAGDRGIRYCLDPIRHPKMPYHVHGPDDEQPRRHAQVTVGEALGRFENFVYAEIQAGRLPE